MNHVGISCQRGHAPVARPNVGALLAAPVSPLPLGEGRVRACFPLASSLKPQARGPWPRTHHPSAFSLQPAVLRCVSIGVHRCASVAHLSFRTVPVSHFPTGGLRPHTLCPLRSVSGPMVRPTEAESLCGEISLLLPPESSSRQRSLPAHSNTRFSLRSPVGTQSRSIGSLQSGSLQSSAFSLQPALTRFAA
jgi:hypothetical protein